MRTLRIMSLLMLCGLLSCDLFDKDPGPCPEIQGVWFKILDVQAENLRDEPGCCITKPAPFAQVEFPYYLIKLDFLAQYYSQALNSPGLSFLNSARASSNPCPRNGQNGSKERIAEIEITSLYDYDAHHGKGSVANDLFDIDDMGSRVSVSEFLSTHQSVRQEYLKFRLRSEPSLNDTCAFKIQIQLDDQSSFTAVTAPVLLLKQ